MTIASLEPNLDNLLVQKVQPQAMLQKAKNFNIWQQGCCKKGSKLQVQLAVLKISKRKEAIYKKGTSPIIPITLDTMDWVPSHQRAQPVDIDAILAKYATQIGKKKSRGAEKGGSSGGM